MSGDGQFVSFVDTNILVYALAADDIERSPVAGELLGSLMRTEVLRTSTQVLQELFVTLTRRVRKPMTREQALRYLDQVAEWPVWATDYGAIRDAIELSGSAHVSFWDALIVVAAARSGARILYTEDLNDGQIILGVKIVNPFRIAKKPLRSR